MALVAPEHDDPDAEAEHPHRSVEAVRPEALAPGPAEAVEERRREQFHEDLKLFVSAAMTGTSRHRPRGEPGGDRPPRTATSSPSRSGSARSCGRRRSRDGWAGA